MPDFIRTVPPGDDRERLTCPECGFVVYENPKIVVGSVVSEGGRILLCRRAIEPRRGYWTLPAGYMEMAETVEEGARREAWEEARARIAFEAGPESLEVQLFGWDEIPWGEIAFPSVHWALRRWQEIAGRPLTAP